MKNPKNMKYLKLFEGFFEMNELLMHLREIAKKIVQNLPEKDGEIIMDDYKIKVSIKTNIMNDDNIKELDALIFKNEEMVGSIYLDFDAPEELIVQYILNLTNEGHTISNYSRKEFLDRDLINIHKRKRKQNWRNNLSESLPK
jgi:hypothetical protein